MGTERRAQQRLQVKLGTTEAVAGGDGAGGEKARRELLFLALTCAALRANKGTAIIKWSHHVFLILFLWHFCYVYYVFLLVSLKA